VTAGLAVHHPTTNATRHIPTERLLSWHHTPVAAMPTPTIPAPLPGYASSENAVGVGIGTAGVHTQRFSQVRRLTPPPPAVPNPRRHTMRHTMRHIATLVLAFACLWAWGPASAFGFLVGYLIYQTIAEIVTDGL
jgi:hypothetical protein